MPHVEIDEVLGLVGDVGAEVPADDGVPGGVVLLVELLFDKGGDVLFDVELLEGHVGAIDGVLLHLLVHVSVLDHCFPLGCRHSFEIYLITRSHPVTSLIDQIN